MEVSPQRTQKLKVGGWMDWIILRKLVLLKHLALQITMHIFQLINILFRMWTELCPLDLPPASHAEVCSYIVFAI